MKYFLAIDIGASSGRHILGHMDNGKIRLEEIYRFDNGMENKDGHLVWDVEKLFTNIKEGLKVCKKINKIPETMGIDTWAVDYVLLDKENNIIGKTYGYRDHRTDGVDEETYNKVSEEKLYSRTGIQRQQFNTIFQLMATKKDNPAELDKAEAMLMLPDYFNFLLTGKMNQEYTNATSTGLVNTDTDDWDEQLIEKLGLPNKIFKPISVPGTMLGDFSEEIQKEIGFNTKVMLVASHDTASAVMSVPSKEDDTLYISSGTWSLMGVENKNAVTSEEARKLNFTNEGGYEYRYRFLKNIMGLWMIQSVRHELNDGFSFAQLCELAEGETEYEGIVDVNDEAFLAPKNMTEAIKKYLKDTNQQEPQTVGQLAKVIYRSLAISYVKTLKEIENLTGKEYDTIHIIGGGSKADYLNKLTARETGCRVLAGPGEGTALGNILAQLIYDGEFYDLKYARECVKESFDIKEYKEMENYDKTREISIS